MEQYTHASLKDPAYVGQGIMASISEDSLESKRMKFLSNKKLSSPKQPQQTLAVHQQNSSSQSSLLKQFSDKVKSQADRLQKLEYYK